MRQARFITEGAALLAIYVMLLFISMYVPILGTVVTFALPLPFILLTIRYKLSNAFVIFTAAFLIVVFVSQPIGLVKTVVFGLMGIVLGCMYKKQRKPLEILITGSLAYLISIMLIYVASIKFFNIDFIKQIQNMFNKSVVQSEKIASVAGMPISKEQKELFVQMNDILQTVFPSNYEFEDVHLRLLSYLFSNNLLRFLLVYAILHN